MLLENVTDVIRAITFRSFNGSNFDRMNGSSEAITFLHYA
jgi:hypothetical protein